MRPRFAALAIVAAGSLIVASILQSLTNPKVDEATVALIDANKHVGLDLTAAVVSAIGSLVIAAVLVFLARAARARHPSMSPLIRVAAIAGAVLAGFSSIVYSVEIAHKAHQFVTTGAQTYQQAHTLESSTVLVALQIAGLLGALLVAMSLVLISMQSMRVGLLPKSMGYLGMLAGALIIFQVFPIPVFEIYWFGALAVLFLGRWPTGQPPAWTTGNAEPWPRAQEMREKRIRAAEERGTGRTRGRKGVRAAVEAKAREQAAAAKAGERQAGERQAGAVAADREADATPATGTGTATRSAAKRKRKRRR